MLSKRRAGGGCLTGLRPGVLVILLLATRTLSLHVNCWVGRQNEAWKRCVRMHGAGRIPIPPATEAETQERMPPPAKAPWPRGSGYGNACKFCFKYDR